MSQQIDLHRSPPQQITDVNFEDHNKHTISHRTINFSPTFGCHVLPGALAYSTSQISTADTQHKTQHLVTTTYYFSTTHSLHARTRALTSLQPIARSSSELLPPTRIRCASTNYVTASSNKNFTTPAYILWLSRNQGHDKHILAPQTFITSTPSDNGNGGAEIWTSKNIPYLITDTKDFFTTRTCIIHNYLHQHIFAPIDNTHFDIALLNVHVPNRQRFPTDNLSQILQFHKIINNTLSSQTNPDRQVIPLGDFNARLGTNIPDIIGTHGSET